VFSLSNVPRLDHISHNALQQAHRGVGVLQPSGVAVAGELGQQHVGHQRVVDGEEGQTLAVRWPPVSQVRAQDLLWRQQQQHTNNIIVLLLQQLIWGKTTRFPIFIGEIKLRNIYSNKYEKYI